MKKILFLTGFAALLAASVTHAQQQPLPQSYTLVLPPIPPGTTLVIQSSTNGLTVTSLASATASASSATTATNINTNTTAGTATATVKIPPNAPDDDKYWPSHAAARAARNPAPPADAVNARDADGLPIFARLTVSDTRKVDFAGERFVLDRVDVQTLLAGGAMSQLQARPAVRGGGPVQPVYSRVAAQGNSGQVWPVYNMPSYPYDP